MAHTYTCLLFHVIFSTKSRLKTITSSNKNRIYGYLKSVAENKNSRLLIINGMEDHVHLLLELKPTIALSELIHSIKGSSSRWIKVELDIKDFSWQSGYAAFSVSQSQKDRVFQYIKNQEEHHKTKSYEEELRSLYDKHGIIYDDRYIID